MYRVYKEEKEGAADEEDKDSKREPQRWDLDYELEPYEGLSPEYMEMGEFLDTNVWCIILCLYKIFRYKIIQIASIS